MRVKGTRPNQRALRGATRGGVRLLMLGAWLFALGVLVTRLEGQTDQEPEVSDGFFSETLYPALELAQCRACHFELGVASATRLHFPDVGAPPDEVDAFGRRLAVLVDRASPENSLLLRKPTNREMHTGGERIKPGSAEEAALRRWVNHLARRVDEGPVVESVAAGSLPQAPLRRLTHSQYNNTVRDLLGDQSIIADRFPAEGFVNGFKNQAVIQGISPALAKSYNDAAETLARNAYRLGELEKRLPCQPSSARDTECRDAFLSQFGHRAFRRPLIDSEMQRYGQLFDQASEASDDFLQGAAMVVEAMLQSPKFLFHLQAGPGEEGYERAGALSYFLWNTMPDEALTRKAAEGELDTVEGVERVARWMLEDPRAHEALDEFFAQWLRFDLTLTTFKNRRLYPEFTPELAASMVEETKTLLRYLVWSDKSFMELFTADYGFINAELAKLYDLPPPPADFTRASFPPNANRGGLLGHGSILAAAGQPGETSPTVRGIFVREHFLCQQVPAPPPGVNTSLPAESIEKPVTTRERLAAHKHNPSCAGCHNLIDPIGFGLENYDTIGRWRDKQIIRPARAGSGEAVELEIDSSGALPGLSSNGSGPAPEFSGSKELGRLLAESEISQECIVRQLSRYAFARAETSADRQTIREATAAFRQSGFRLKEVLVALVKSPQFLGEAAARTGHRAGVRAESGAMIREGR